MVQLVTSKPSDVGTDVSSNLGALTRTVFVFVFKEEKIMPNKWRTISSWVHEIRLHGRLGKETAESFSREKLRQAPQKEGE